MATVTQAGVKYGGAMKASKYLAQYLNTATGGNVFVEYALEVQRWRLVCKKCGKSRTYGAEYDLETAYEKEGVLDSSIQKFAKEHRHTLFIVPSPDVGVYPAHVVTQIPRRTSGRKIRP